MADWRDLQSFKNKTPDHPLSLVPSLKYCFPKQSRKPPGRAKSNYILSLTILAEKRFLQPTL